jgi:hypothetical protein
LSPLPKVHHANLPIRPYDRTPEENARIAKEHYDAQIKKKEPEPRPEYTEKQIAYAKYLLTLPSQYDLHYKPDDYTRILPKEGKKSRSRASASGSKSSISKKKIRCSLAWTTGQTIDPTPQGVIRECSLSGAGARFRISTEVGE